MTVLVLGATPSALAAVRRGTTTAGTRIVTRAGWGRPAWVLVATSGQRAAAIARYRLPSFRVVHVPGLDSDTPDAAQLSFGLSRMQELGPCVPAVRPRHERVTRALMPLLAVVIERVLGASGRDNDREVSAKAARAAEKAAAREARLRERAPKTETDIEALRRAERKAQRKQERRSAERAVMHDKPEPERLQ